MHAAADRPEFTPPPPPGLLRAMVLAVIAHLLLLLALTYGLNWQRQTQDVAAEAELWSQLPQQAAPRAEPTPPPPPPPPPPVNVVKAPPLPVRTQADIALEREKEKRELEREKREAQKREADRREAVERRQAEADREKQRKAEAQRKRDDEVARKKEQAKEQARQLAEARRKDDEKKLRQQEQDAKKVAQLREENLRRMQGMAGTGAPGATGTAAQSSGPSSSWAGRVRGRVKPNIVFSDDVPGNPQAVVEVRLAPDGTITSKRITKSSGVRSWDDAVLRALDKTEVLPRDVDGRVPSLVELSFRPRD
jgi:colicin import membrane protein